MSQHIVVEFTHPDILSVYPSVLALIESTKNDTKPFDAIIIMKLLVSFQNHVNSIYPRTMISPDFKNMLYTLVEQQQSFGFIISPSLKKEIDTYRDTMDKNPMNLHLQKFLIDNAKLE
jgi:hypothetical protein